MRRRNLRRIGGARRPNGESASHNAGTIEVSVEAQKEGGIVTETVKQSFVPETFQAMGRVLQDAQKPHHVTAGGPGRLETLAIALGQAVNPGEVLAVTKSPAGSASNVTAPHQGIVTAMHVGEGDQVNEMTFLFTLTDVDPLWGVLDIPERSLGQLRPGQKVEYGPRPIRVKCLKGRSPSFPPKSTR